MIKYYVIMCVLLLSIVGLAWADSIDDAEAKKRDVTVAAAGSDAPTSLPTATSATKQAEIPTLTELLNKIPERILPNPKGNPIREEANGKSRKRWLAENATNQRVKFEGYVPVKGITREHALVIAGVFVGGKRASISSSWGLIEIKGPRDERLTVHGQYLGMLCFSCSPKLSPSGRTSIEPLLELQGNDKVTIVGTLTLTDADVFKDLPGIQENAGKGYAGSDIVVTDCTFTINKKERPSAPVGK